MLNIIKSDLYRILRGKAIYIAIILMLVMAGFSVFGMSPRIHRNSKCRRKSRNVTRRNGSNARN